MIRDKASPKILENKIFENMNQVLIRLNNSYYNIIVGNTYCF